MPSVPAWTAADLRRLISADRFERLAEQVSVARQQATDGGQHPVVPGKVVAELHFGFWRYLLASKYYTALWVPALSAAFPHLPVRDRKSASANRMVFDALGNLNKARNRVAHHEPVTASARAWINDTGRITAVLATRPQP